MCVCKIFMQKSSVCRQKKSMRLCFSTSTSPSSAFHHHHRKSNFRRTQKTSSTIVASSESSSKMERKKSLLATPLKCMIPTCVYLDYNATTPIFPEVCDEMLPFDARCSEPPTTTQVFSAPSPRGPGKAVVSERAGTLANCASIAD